MSTDLKYLGHDELVLDSLSSFDRLRIEVVEKRCF